MWLIEVSELAELWYFYQKHLESDIARSGICHRILIGVLWGRRNGTNSRTVLCLKKTWNTY